MAPGSCILPHRDASWCVRCIHMSSRTWVTPWACHWLSVSAKINRHPGKDDIIIRANELARRTRRRRGYRCGAKHDVTDAPSHRQTLFQRLLCVSGPRTSHAVDTTKPASRLSYPSKTFQCAVWLEAVQGLRDILR